ncbi:hypothetical protein NXX19_27840 [Bacteroides ovatus]|nr:hypothetical protein [Bacteroides ovatus]
MIRLKTSVVATPEYKNYGYAELIDLYATGNYYTDITIEEYKKNEPQHLERDRFAGSSRYMVLCRRFLSALASDS